MKIIITAFLLCLGIVPLHLCAKENLHVYVSGHIENGGNDSVSIIIMQYDILKEVDRRYTAIADAEGIFAIHIPLPGPHGNRLGQISFRSAGYTHTLIRQVYLLEEYDTLYLDIYRQNNLINYHLSGNRIFKFECEKEIGAILNKANIRTKALNIDDSDLMQKVKNIYLGYDVRIEHVLHKYKTKIRPAAYGIIEADSYGALNANNGLFELLEKMVHRDKISANKALLFFRQLPIHQRNFSESNILLSKDLAFWLLTKKRYELLFADQKGISYLEVYNETKKEKDGIVRDLLLVNSLKILDGMIQTEKARDSIRLLWNDAVNSMRTPDLIAYCQKRTAYKSRGSELSEFNLKDSVDADINLSSFVNKVLLIDVWFTGCTSCVKHNRFMNEKIYPLFANDSNVLFISICADADKSTWLKSLRGGRYTRPENINLHTGGLGFDHPFLKYYEFDAGGVTLLIGKNGNIFSGDPPIWDAISLVTEIQRAENENPLKD